jgi:hypothetical protein
MAVTVMVWCLPAAIHLSIARTQPDLAFPRDLTDLPRQAFQLCLLALADPGGEAIGPSAFDEYASSTAVSGLGNATTPDVLAGRVF